ncbi:hypothetical protein KY290_027439 [Solanum tuberosum]|uniref:Uncharacterized protein n=1 Tax=Solanum tuberosum TaxID=4113 RepID=A0ABQ7UGT5_SOLTU|nr:hypothetical protein KY285_026366 [Solanum tuberosum]KAH0748207.1 hypothetical protein KY290_027439 [Solanum tuberosum]
MVSSTSLDTQTSSTPFMATISVAPPIPNSDMVSMVFIDGSHPCPEPTLTMENGTSTINHVFQQWVQLDSIVLSWIQATISQEILPAIIRPNNGLTAHLVLQVLSGLSSKYLSVSTSISTRISLPSFLETISLLFLHETQLNGISSAASDSSTALLAKHNSYSQGHGRGRNSNGGRYEMVVVVEVATTTTTATIEIIPLLLSNLLHVQTLLPF